MDWIKEFKWFHAHPELGFHEYKTTKRIKDALDENGVEILKSGLETGLIAIVRGKHKGKSIAIRGDIDALPIIEKTNLKYKSKHDGVMHACGHDLHIVATLGAAVAVNNLKDNLKGNVYFIFQPAEEAIYGADTVVATGLLKDVHEYYCIHSEPSMEIANIGIVSGGVRAATDQFKIEISGVGTHAAAPHLGSDPIEITAQMISALRTFADRELDPLERRVISFTHVEGGSAWNIIPEKVFFEGTVRTLSDNARATIKKNFKEIVSQFNGIGGVSCSLTWTDGPAPVINDDELLKICTQAGTRLKLTVVNSEPTMLGDDFSAFLSNGNKGAYIKFGVGIGKGLHNPQYKVDTRSIEPAIAYLTEIVKCALS